MPNDTYKHIGVPNIYSNDLAFIISAYSHSTIIDGRMKKKP